MLTFERIKKTFISSSFLREKERELEKEIYAYFF